MASCPDEAPKPARSFSDRATFAQFPGCGHIVKLDWLPVQLVSNHSLLASRSESVDHDPSTKRPAPFGARKRFCEP